MIGQNPTFGVVPLAEQHSDNSEDMQLLPAERHRRMMEALTVRGALRVAELARMFSVTEETVRRDLSRLEEEGLIERSHGGAMRVEKAESESPYWMREVRNRPEKNCMARMAVRHVREGDRIFIDASSTGLHVAQHLPNFEGTVMTNSMQTADVLARQNQIRVILIGGEVSARSMSCLGAAATSMLEGYHADLLFLSCRGIDFERGIYDVSEQQAAVRKCMLDQADRRILLMDHTKYQVRSLIRVAGLEVFDHIIVDRPPEAPILDVVQRKGLTLDIAGDSNGPAQQNQMEEKK